MSVQGQGFPFRFCSVGGGDKGLMEKEGLYACNLGQNSSVSLKMANIAFWPLLEQKMVKICTIFKNDLIGLFKGPGSMLEISIYNGGARV